MLGVCRAAPLIITAIGISNLMACGSKVTVGGGSGGSGTGAAGSSGAGATSTSTTAVGGGGTGGATSTSTTAVGGGGTGGVGGLITGGAGGTGGAPDPGLPCSPAPLLGGEVVPPVPADATAEIAAVGSWARVAVGPDGDGVFVSGVWNRVVARRHHAGQWLDPEPLVATENNVGMPEGSVAVAAGPGGSALLLYGEYHGPQITMCSRLFEPGSGWSAPVKHAVVDEGFFNPPAMPRVAAAMNAAGNAVVVWTGKPNVMDGVSVRRYSAAAGWSAPLLLSEEISFAPWLVLRDDDSAVVVWDDIVAGPILAAHSPGSAAGWGAPEQVGPSGAYPQIGPGPNGSNVALWYSSDGNTAHLETAVRSQAGQWSAPQEILSQPGTIWQPALATDSSGFGLASWEISSSACGHDSRIWIRTANGAFQDATPVPVYDDSPATVSRLAANDAGLAIIAWEHLDPQTCDWHGANLTWVDAASGAWSSQDLDASLDARDPEVALAPDGRALAAWHRMNGPVLARWVDLDGVP